jgi:aspartate/methionine/tyrosine aminotransferase
MGAAFNLAESTTLSLTFGELIALVDEAGLRDLRLDYGPIEGSAALRGIVGRACGVRPDHVLTTHGATVGLSLVTRELGDDGEVVLATPCFSPVRQGCAAGRAGTRHVRLEFDEGYRLAPGRVAAVIGPATRLVCLASPHNPSGVRIGARTVRDVLALMAERSPKAFLLVDETFREATYDAEAAPASVAGLDPRVITCGSVSKAHGAPGLRVGWLTIPDDGLRARLTEAKVNATGPVSPLDEALAVALLSRREAVLAPRAGALGRALETVEVWRAGEAHRLDWIRPEAGALCCLRLRRARFDAAAVARFWTALSARGVALAPGGWFGEAERIFRLGFGHVSAEDLPGALAAISGALDQAESAVPSAERAGPAAEAAE